GTGRRGEVLDADGGVVVLCFDEYRASSHVDAHRDPGGGDGVLLDRYPEAVHRRRSGRIVQRVSGGDLCACFTVHRSLNDGDGAQVDVSALDTDLHLDDRGGAEALRGAAEDRFGFPPAARGDVCLILDVQVGDTHQLSQGDDAQLEAMEDLARGGVVN